MKRTTLSYHNKYGDFTLGGLKIKLNHKKKELAGKADNYGISRMIGSIKRIEEEIKEREKLKMKSNQRINNDVVAKRHRGH